VAISVTASGRSPITATVISRPATKGSAMAWEPQVQSRAICARRLSPPRMMLTPTEEPSLGGFNT
jgi:hypothetical protein